MQIEYTEDESRVRWERNGVWHETDLDELIEAWERMPTIDAVPVGVYEQTRWERDMAIEQLAEIGKSLCEKMDNVATVVRCNDCISFDKGGICQLHEINRSENDFCSDVERSEE